MSELGELDRPGTPNSPGAWDEHSEEWLTGAAETDERYGTRRGPAHVAEPPRLPPVPRAGGPETP